MFVNWILVDMHQGTLLLQNFDALEHWITFCILTGETLDPGIANLDEFPGTLKSLVKSYSV